MTLALPSNVPMMTADSRTPIRAATTSLTDDATSDDSAATGVHWSADRVVFGVEEQSTIVDIHVDVVSDDGDANPSTLIVFTRPVLIVVCDATDWTIKSHTSTQSPLTKIFSPSLANPLTPTVVAVWVQL